MCTFIKKERFISLAACTGSPPIQLKIEQTYPARFDEFEERRIPRSIINNGFRSSTESGWCVFPKVVAGYASTASVAAYGKISGRVECATFTKCYGIVYSKRAKS
jgi:hypothetical protein